jgi:hypothetical protein
MSDGGNVGDVLDVVGENKQRPLPLCPPPHLAPATSLRVSQPVSVFPQENRKKARFEIGSSRQQGPFGLESLTPKNLPPLALPHQATRISISISTPCPLSHPADLT